MSHQHATMLADALTRPLDAGDLGILADLAEEHVPERFEEVLRRLICAVPDDDAPRLRLADWWGGERGEFIRVQCELAKLIGDGTCCPVCDWPFMKGGCEPNNCAFRPGRGTAEYARWLKRQNGFHNLRRCEQELLSEFAKTLRAIYGDKMVCLVWAPMCMIGVRPNGGNIEWAEYGDAGIEFSANTPVIELYPRRGFVESITCTAADFFQHADAITAREPVRRVRLTTWPSLHAVYHPEKRYTQIGIAEHWTARISDLQLSDSPNANRYFQELLRQAICDVFKNSWPRIEFEVPNPKQTVQLPHIYS